MVTGSKVSLYSFTLIIDKKRYTGELPASSWEEAEKLAQKLGTAIDGRIEEDIYIDKVCSICAQDLRVDRRNPQPISKDWRIDFE